MYDLVGEVHFTQTSGTRGDGERCQREWSVGQSTVQGQVGQDP